MARVFVVDDETSARELVYDALSGKGYEVTTASSASQALEMLKAQRPELILLDAAMPGMSGLEAAKRIREFDDAVPILLLTIPGEPDPDPEELKRAGVSGLLRKERNAELFRGALELVLKRLRGGEAAPPAGAPAMRVPGSLLIVDDDPKLLRLMMSFFESRGLRVILASSGEEALKSVDQKPMAVLLDVNMPGMDGLMTLRKIKAKHPALPVIIASGVGEEATIREAMESGAYDYVTKPFNLDYLETVVLTKVLLGIEG